MSVNVTNYLNYSDKDHTKKWVDHVLKPYLECNPEVQSDIEHILDFLDSKKTLPNYKKLKYEIAFSHSKNWIATLNFKAASISEDITDIEDILDFEDGFKLVRLIGKKAFQREGREMSHCIGSYNPGHQNEHYSIRDSKNMPHGTIEVSRSNNSILQIKGKGNGPIHPKYIEYTIKALKHFGMAVREGEMLNLGYINYDVLSENAKNIIKSFIKSPKFFTFNNVTYLYIGSFSLNEKGLEILGTIKNA